MAGSKPLSPSSLPPGCRFYPSEEQLLCYYLTNKNSNRNNDVNGGGETQGCGEVEAGFYGCDLIRELDVYDYDPFELPEVSRFSYGFGGRKRHWYCYTTLNDISSTEDKTRKIWRRKVKNGHWRRKGSIKNVFGNGGKPLLGIRTTFVFHLGNSKKNAGKTDWFLYEYALLGHRQDSFVVCRVFVKSRQRNNISENGLSSCAEESISAVRHIGVQHDAFVRPHVENAEAHDDNSVDRKDAKSACLEKSISDPNGNHSKTMLSSDSQFPITIQNCQQMSSSGLPKGGAMFSKTQGDGHVLSILEEDFIELDDLIN